MDTVQISDRYRVTIPESIRKELGLRVGDELVLEKVGEGVYRFGVVEKGSRYHDQLLQLLKTPPKRVGKPVDISPAEMKRLEEPKT